MIQIIKKIALGAFTVVVLTGVANAAQIASKEYVDAQNVIQTADIENDIQIMTDAKADRTSPGESGELGIISGGNYIGSGVISTDMATVRDLSDMAVSADVVGKEDKTNKSNNITIDMASPEKYTSVKAVEDFAIPLPPSRCVGAQADCVLSVNKISGDVYWEDIATP